MPCTKSADDMSRIVDILALAGYEHLYHIKFHILYVHFWLYRNYQTLNRLLFAHYEYYLCGMYQMSSLCIVNYDISFYLHRQ